MDVPDGVKMTNVVIDHGGTQFVVSYPTARLTDEVCDELVEATKSEDLMDLVAMLARLLDSWDLTDDDDTPIKLSKDALAKLPFGLPIKIAAEIRKDRATRTIDRQEIRAEELRRREQRQAEPD